MKALTYGYGSPEGAGADFWVRFERCSREPASWRIELQEAARSIANTAKKPIWVCASGGIGSEAVCRAFLEAGVRFSILVLEYEAGENRHALKRVWDWCQERTIEMKAVKMDLTEFLDSGTKKYGDEYPASHPVRYLQLRLLETVSSIGGYAVLGGESIQFRAPREKNEDLVKQDLFATFTTGITVPLEWCKKNGVEHEPYFHLRHPELVLSYMRIPIIDFALNHPEPIFRHKVNPFALRRIAYQSEWPDMDVRYMSAEYENMRRLYGEAQEQLRDEHVGALQSVDVSTSEIEAQLVGAGPKVV